MRGSHNPSKPLLLSPPSACHALIVEVAIAYGQPPRDGVVDRKLSSDLSQESYGW